MKISFGNVTLELNIFHVEKRPRDDDECQQTFMIDILVPEEVQLQENSNNPSHLLQNSESERFGLDELPDISAIHSRIKAKMKKALNKQIMRKNLEPNQQVYLYYSHPLPHPDKLRQWWIGPFVIKQILPNGAIEIEDLNNGRILRVSGQRLKNYVEQLSQVEEFALRSLIY